MKLALCSAHTQRETTRPDKDRSGIEEPKKREATGDEAKFSTIEQSTEETIRNKYSRLEALLIRANAITLIEYNDETWKNEVPM